MRAASLDTLFVAAVALTALVLSGCGGGQASAGSTGATIPDAQATLVDPSTAQTARFSVPVDDMEVLAPFASWANVKRDFGAKGDGATDDTAALQKALDTIGRAGQANVLYLPAGTYKITATLTWAGNFSLVTGTTIIGESPGKTSVVWAGPPGGAMLVQNGGTFFRYSRITWNGMKTAGYGVAQMWDMSSGTIYGGSTEHEDEVFEDMGIGIMAGRMGKNFGNLDSEGVIRRVTFLRNTYAGFDTGSWNALDWWIWDSKFIDCARGATNTFAITDTGTGTGAGAFYIYRSLFQRSTVADVDIGNTGWFSMYHNTSVGSRRFFQAAQLGRNGAPVIIVGNKILDTTDPISISNGNMGLVTLIDNQIRSLPGTTGPVVVMNDFLNGRSLFSTGNQFTVTNPIGFQTAKQDATDRLTSVNDSTVAISAISSTLPTLPSTPPMVSRQIFEVSLGSDGGKNAAAIQAAVNSAVQAASKGAVNPVVHLPLGTFWVSRTIVVPAQARIQIVGDDMRSTLNWNGNAIGPVFQLQGPSYATVRDLQVWSPATVPAIGITHADQAGGRIFIEGSSPGPVAASNLTLTQLAAQANPGIKTLTFHNVNSWASIGTGGIGPVTSTGNSSTSKVLIADTWYEGTDTHLYRVDSGNFTYVGGQMSPASHDGTDSAIVDDPAVLLSKASGNITFMNFGLDLEKVPAGVGIEIDAETPATNVLVIGAGTYTNSGAAYFKRTSSAGSVGLALSSKYNPTIGYVPIADEGLDSTSFILRMLAELRSLEWETSAYQAPARATDVRIYRFGGQNSGGLSVTD